MCQMMCRNHRHLCGSEGLTGSPVLANHRALNRPMEQGDQEEKGPETTAPTAATATVDGTNTTTKKTNLISLTYNGQTIISAASQGNLPVCVLLWGMASAKKINIMSPDIHGNNPMHYACLAQTSEVMGFFHQQLRGMLTPELRLVDSINNAGETPLLRAMATGQMTVIKVWTETDRQRECVRVCGFFLFVRRPF
jgi:ankyrin repeat protein